VNIFLNQERRKPLTAPKLQNNSFGTQVWSATPETAFLFVKDMCSLYAIMQMVNTHGCAVINKV
jgi:hypothetical protein